MKTRCAIAVVFLLSVVLYFCLVLQSHGQAFTPLRPFIPTSQVVSNLTPEQLASYGLALRWVASDLGTNSLNVNTWTDRVQQAIWRMDEATQQPAYTTNNGVSLDLTHRLTNNTIGPYFQTCSNCVAFGFIMDITKIGDWNTHIFPGLICNSLPGQPSGASTMKWGFDTSSFQDPPGFPLSFWISPTEKQIITNRYYLTNVWHDLVVGSYWTNTLLQPWIYEITNGFQWSTNTPVAGAQTGAGWGMPYDPSIGYSNFPTSLAYDWHRDSSVIFYLKELWIWTNNYFPVGRLTDSIVTNFHIYATNTYNYSP